MTNVRTHERSKTLAETAVRAQTLRALILDAARIRLLADGYGGLSTRKVADEAAVPLSQLHYHFGSKQGLILAVLEVENQRRLARQQNMYAEDAPLWQRYQRACDFLEDDLDSGYVRVLQEMIAAGWSNEELGDAVRELLGGWYALLAQVAREAEQRSRPARSIHRRGDRHAGGRCVPRCGVVAATRLRPECPADPLSATPVQRGDQGI